MKELEKAAEEWREWLVGKNKHSVYSRCYECKTWGINFPLDYVCGNCNTKEPTTTFYDEKTIDLLVTHERASVLKSIHNFIMEKSIYIEEQEEFLLFLDQLLGEDSNT